MNNKLPSKKILRENKPKGKEILISNHRSSCECADDLTNSRRLCSTNHNARSLAQLQPSNITAATSVTKKGKGLEREGINHQRSGSREKKSPDGTNRRLDSDQSEEVGEYRKGGQQSRKQSARKKEGDHGRHGSEYICQCCKENDRQELFLKYKTEVLKTTFLKEEVDKLKSKLTKVRVDNRPEEKSSPALMHSTSHKVFYAFPVFRLGNNKERNSYVQGELSRLRQMFQEGSSLERICHVFNSVLGQLKEHITELEELDIEEGKYKSRAVRQNKEYQDLISKLNDEVKQLKSKLKKSIRQNVELSDQAEDQKQELKMLRAMVENERDHVKGTDTNFEKLHREYSKLVIENEALQSKHNDIKQSNDRLVELRGELERQFERNIQELELANEEINFLKIENQKLKSRKTQFESTCDRLQFEIKELRQKASLEKEKLAKSKHRLEEQFMSKTHELAEAERLEQRMLGLIRDNDQLRKQLDLKELQLADTMGKLEISERQLVLRNSEMRNLAAENSQLLADVANCRKEIQALHIDIGELKRTTENYKNRQLMKSKKSVFEDDYASRELSKERQQIHSVDNKDREGRLKALADIQTLIRRHRQQVD